MGRWGERRFCSPQAAALLRRTQLQGLVEALQSAGGVLVQGGSSLLLQSVEVAVNDVADGGANAEAMVSCEGFELGLEFVVNGDAN